MSFFPSLRTHSRLLVLARRKTAESPEIDRYWVAGWQKGQIGPIRGATEDRATAQSGPLQKKTSRTESSIRG